MSLRTPFLASLGLVDVVSFDIFDTAIVRKIEHPIDVFYQLEATAAGLGTGPLGSIQAISPGFAKSRIEAEVRARRVSWESCRHHEVTLSEIYGQLAESLDLGPDLIQQLMGLELDLELAHATRNHRIAELYDLCLDQGKSVGFVSDIYHDRDLIASLLAKAGYRDYEFLVVSSESRATKASGLLYARLLREWRIKPSRWLHVGDNLLSDVGKAKKAGLRALHYPKCLDQLGKHPILASRLIGRQADQYPAADLLPKSHLRGLIAARCFASLPAASQPLARESSTDLKSMNGCFWSDWGYQHAGPLVLGFSSWILRQIREAGLDRIYFLSRDGYFVKQVFEQLINHAGNSAATIESRYLYASRRSLNLATIETVAGTDLDFLVSGTSRLSVADYLSRIDISAADVLRSIQQAGFADAKTMVENGAQFRQLRRLFIALSPLLLKRATGEFNLLVEYFRQEGLADHSHAAIVDIGWHGSLQLSLVRLLKRIGSETRLSGYYLGTFPPALKHIRQGLSLHSYLCDLGLPKENYLAIRQCVEIYEWFFSAPHGTVCGFRRQGSSVIPILELQDIDHERWQTASLAQQGAMRFVDDYLACQLPGFVPVMSPQLANHMLRGFLEHPTHHEALNFGNLKHAEGFGRVVVPRFIAKPEFSRRNPCRYLQMAKSYRNSFWRNGYLKRIGLLSAVNLARVTRHRLHNVWS